MIQCIYFSVFFLRRANVKGPNWLTSTANQHPTQQYFQVIKKKQYYSKPLKNSITQKKTQPAPVSLTLSIPAQSLDLTHSTPSAPPPTAGDFISHRRPLSSLPLHSSDVDQVRAPSSPAAAAARCMNAACGAPAPTAAGVGEWRKDWPLRSGGFAVLCDKCGYASPFLLPPPSPLPHSALPLRVRAGSVPNGLAGSLARRLDESIHLDALPTFPPCLFLSRRRCFVPCCGCAICGFPFCLARVAVFQKSGVDSVVASVDTYQRHIEQIISTTWLCGAHVEFRFL